ncbi:MAG: PASTA domain-containing protein [Lacibacter sp.]
MFQFITNRSFFFNLVIALLLAFAVFFVFFQLLGIITQHGDYIKVPEVKGKNIAEAKKILESQGFEVEVQDSVYYDSLPKLSIVKQNPEPAEMVKVHRTIYLTVNRSQAPLVSIPNFVGQTYRSVQLQINTLGLKMGDTISRPDFAVGSVLEQLFKGRNIVPGTALPMGSKIDLVIGGGLQRQEMAVPDLIGMTYGEAKVFLESNNLLLGSTVTDGVIKDSSNALVWKQNPPRRDDEGRPLRIRGGQLVDVYITNDRSKIESSDNSKPPVIKEESNNEY